MKLTPKSFAVALCMLVLVIVGYLAAFASQSSAHRAARAALEQSEAIEVRVGRPLTAFLIGVRQKLVPGGVSCTRGTYLVYGPSGLTVATVHLSLQGFTGDWKVEEIAGWSGGTAQSC